jgi:outer membrane protein assembly factor BamB
MAELGVAKPRWGFAGSPLVQEDLLVLNVGGAGTALAKATGKVVWASNTNAAGYASPVPFTRGGERCVAIFSAKELLGVQVRNGEVVWRLPWVTKWDLNIPDPIIVGDKLFLSTFDRGCALLQLGDSEAKVVWANKSMANHFNCCVYFDGCLFGIDGNTDAPPKDLRCVELATGEVKWKYTGFGLGSLMVADGKLIVLGDKGELAVADASPTRFKAVARAQLLGGKCWTTPVLANGRVYCRNAQGTLVCVDVRPAAPR